VSLSLFLPHRLPQVLFLHQVRPLVVSVLPHLLAVSQAVPVHLLSVLLRLRVHLVPALRAVPLFPARLQVLRLAPVPVHQAFHLLAVLSAVLPVVHHFPVVPVLAHSAVPVQAARSAVAVPRHHSVVPLQAVHLVRLVPAAVFHHLVVLLVLLLL